jgi:predicted Zn-dependent protease
MNMITIIAATMLLLGCEDEEMQYCDHDFGYPVLPLTIDSDCTEEHTESIVEAVDRLNDWTNKHLCQEMIEVQDGFVDIDHEDRLVPQETAICYYDRPSWFDGVNQKFLGLAGHGTKVRLFWFQEPGIVQRYQIAIIMHELGHYIGLDHVDGDAVMAVYIDVRRTSFTNNDTKELCSVYECEQ